MNQPNLLRTSLIFGFFALSTLSAGEPHYERTRSEDQFHLDVPYSTAAPLFGALAEKKWDPDWHPEFLYPSPAADQEGSVFIVSHEGHRSLWTTTVFDLERGHVQYLYIIEGLMVTRIDIHLSRPESGGTDVRVVYERTALDPSANAHLKALGENDHHRIHWKAAIEAAASK